LQHPDEDIVRQWEKSNGNEAGGPVKLYPTAEKSPRGTFSQGVLFPEIASSFLSTYCRLICPAMMHSSRKVASDLASTNRTLLVHTETALSLSGKNMRSSLRQYVGGLGGLSGDLPRVTVMTVRASFESMMFRLFRKGEFPGQSFDEFLWEFVEGMNTSSEML
jgi:hypothetical protein